MNGVDEIMMPKFCNSCGTSLKELAKFCNACGAAVSQGKDAVAAEYGNDSVAAKTSAFPSHLLVAIVAILLIAGGIFLYAMSHPKQEACDDGTAAIYPNCAGAAAVAAGSATVGTGEQHDQTAASATVDSRAASANDNFASIQDIVGFCNARPSASGDQADWPKNVDVELRRAYNRSQTNGVDANGQHIDMNWRCKNSRILACAAHNSVGGLKCVQSDTSRVATADMEKACRDDPQMPLFSYARYSVWDWQCENGSPTIKGQTLPITDDGYIAEEWFDITNALRK